MSDLQKYDLETASIESVKAAWYAIPFLVPYRLFVLKNALVATKDKQGALMVLLSSLPPSSVCVLYETKKPDKRTALYKWLVANAKVDECQAPKDTQFAMWIRSIARENAVTIAVDAERLMVESLAGDTWATAQTVAKLAAYVKSQGGDKITAKEVDALCVLPQTDSAFALSDALYAPKSSRVVEVLSSLLRRDDPLQLAALLTAHLRALTTAWLSIEAGVPSAKAAAMIDINPYVVSLAIPRARKLSLTQLRQAYQNVVDFDINAKNGNTPPALGLLLLVIRLRDTLVQGG